MSDDHDATSQALPPHAQLIQMGTASWISAVVYAAAKLGIADHLAAGPRSAVELAGTTRTHAPSLYRLMRTLAGLGILTERGRAAFRAHALGRGAQGRRSRLSASDVDGVLRPGILAQLGGDPLFAGNGQDGL